METITAKEAAELCNMSLSNSGLKTIFDLIKNESLEGKRKVNLKRELTDEEIMYLTELGYLVQTIDKSKVEYHYHIISW